MMRILGLVLLAGSITTSGAFASVRSIKVTRVVAGNYSTCAILSNGSAKCWGHSLRTLTNNPSQPYAGNPIPQPVLGLSGKIESLAVGEGHACATFKDGTSGCWGKPDGAESFYLHGKDQRNLVPVVGFGFEPIAGLSQIATNKETTCAVQDSSRTVFCWGPNRRGMRGVGVSGDISLLNGWATPIEWRSYSDRSVSTLSVGNSHSCIIARGYESHMSTIYCWGNNTQCESQSSCQGEKPEAEVMAMPSFVLSNHDGNAVTPAAVMLGVGDGFTCLLTDDSAVDCWGMGFTRTGGHVPETEHFYKDSIYGKEIFNHKSGVISIAASGDRACAIKDDGSVWCWGQGYYYDGQMHPLLAPWKVQGLDGVRVKQITMNVAHACALTETSQVYCWGYNPDGQLGRDTHGATDARAGLVQGL